MRPQRVCVLTVAMLFLLLFGLVWQSTPPTSAATPEAIPNFSDGFVGTAPDVGAHFRGEEQILYGVRAK